MEKCFLDNVRSYKIGRLDLVYRDSLIKKGYNLATAYDGRTILLDFNLNNLNKLIDDAKDVDEYVHGIIVSNEVPDKFKKYVHLSLSVCDDYIE